MFSDEPSVTKLRVDSVESDEATAGLAGVPDYSAKSLMSTSVSWGELFKIKPYQNFNQTTLSFSINISTFLHSKPSMCKTGLQLLLKKPHLPTFLQRQKTQRFSTAYGPQPARLTPFFHQTYSTIRQNRGERNQVKQLVKTAKRIEPQGASRGHLEI